MKKLVFLFAIIFTSCFTASAQFSFTSKAGKTFSVSSPPARTDYRGATSIFDYYYTVEDSDLVVYEVIRDEAKTISEIRVINVPIETIDKDYFRVRKGLVGGCILQTGKAYTRYTHAASSNSQETYSEGNLQLDFKTCEEAEAFRGKVLDDELGLGDLDLDLSDKPKEEPKSTMPAHLFALLGGGSRKTYQFSRKTDEIWDMTDNKIFKVGKISGSGEDVQMLDKTDSFYVYKLKNNRLYNGDKATAYSLINDSVCKSIGGGKCDEVFRISRDDESIYSLASDGSKYKYYKIMGQASNEEIFIILALLENLR